MLRNNIFLHASGFQLNSASAAGRFILFHEITFHSPKPRQTQPSEKGIKSLYFKRASQAVLEDIS